MSEHEVRDIVFQKFTRLIKADIAMAEAYYTVLLRVCSHLIPPRDDELYWRAVVNALWMKTEMGMPEMDPGLEAEDRFVRFVGRYTERLISVLGHYEEALSYIHDHFQQLPESIYRRIRTVESIQRELVGIDQERQRYLCGEIAKMPRSRIGELNNHADRLIHALLGDRLFEQFIRESKDACDILRRVQAQMVAGSGQNN